MTIEDDLSRIAEQEKVLSFDAFDLTTAWQLGRASCRERVYSNV